MDESNNVDIETKTVDLVLGKQDKIELMLQTLDASVDNDGEFSDENDPLHDSSLLSELFYTTKAANNADESSVLFSDDNDHNTSLDEAKKITKDQKLNCKQQNGLNENVDDTSSLENISMEESGSVTNNNHTSTPMSQKLNIDICQKLLPEGVSIQQLTTLGRVKSAKIMLQEFSLDITENIGIVYFIEFKFPVSVENNNGAPAVELIRLVSRNVSENIAVFNRFSIVPIYFNEKMVEYWWNNHVLLKIFVKHEKEEKPQSLGECYMRLRDVVLNNAFSVSYALDVYQADSNEQKVKKKTIVGKLKVRMVDKYSLII